MKVAWFAWPMALTQDDDVLVERPAAPSVSLAAVMLHRLRNNASLTPATADDVGKLFDGSYLLLDRRGEVTTRIHEIGVINVDGRPLVLSPLDETPHRFATAVSLVAGSSVTRALVRLETQHRLARTP